MLELLDRQALARVDHLVDRHGAVPPRHGDPIDRIQIAQTEMRDRWTRRRQRGAARADPLLPGAATRFDRDPRADAVGVRWLPDEIHLEPPFPAAPRVEVVGGLVEGL